MSTETSLSTQDSYSRSPSTGYEASAAQSPPLKEDGISSSSFVPKSSAQNSDGFIAPPNNHSRSIEQSYPRRASIGRSPPVVAYAQGQDTPYSSTRSTQSLFPQQQGAAIFDRQPFTYTPSPAFGARANDYASQAPIRSYPRPTIDKDFPYTLPPVRTSSNAHILPPMAPPSNDPRLTSSLATLLLAAETLPPLVNDV
jgi:hypothetical protein